MTLIDGEYLYIIQLREDVQANRKIYKFGRTSKEPTNNRFKDYPKNSRPWLILITNDSVKAETEILRILRKTFKQRTDRGKEYFEVDNVLDMIKVVYDYHRLNFVNIYVPDVFNGDDYFLNVRDKMLNDDDEEKIKYFKTSDINSDFALYLVSNGWQSVPSRGIVKITKDKYDEFIDALESRAVDESNDSIEAVIDEDDKDSEVEDESKQVKSNTNTENNDVKVNSENNDVKIKPKVIKVNNEAKATKVNNESNASKINNEANVSKPSTTYHPSIEQFSQSFTSYAKEKKIELVGKTTQIHFKYNESNPSIISVEQIKVIDTKTSKPVCLINEPSLIGDECTSISLSETKLRKLQKVLKPNTDKYMMVISSFIKKRFKPSNSKRWIKYITVEFKLSQ